MSVSEWTNCIINLNSMSSLRGRFVATIFVIRFFPQKLFGKLIGKIDWKICWKNCLEIWLEMLGGNVGWKICWKNCLENLLEKCVGKMCWKICWKNVLEKYVGNVGWKCWLNIWLEKMLVNGCEIIGEKIVATNPPLRLSTVTHRNSFQSEMVCMDTFIEVGSCDPDM